LLCRLLHEEQAEVVVGEVSVVGEQEVRGDVAARARQPPSTPGHLEDRGSVPVVRVGAGAERASRPEGDGVAGSEVELTRLDERPVVPELELAATDRRAVADPFQLPGT